MSDRFDDADTNPGTAYELGRGDERTLTDAALAARTAECLEVACAAVCLNCSDGVPVALSGKNWGHGVLSCCFAHGVRRAFAARWPEEKQ